MENELSNNPRVFNGWGLLLAIFIFGLSVVTSIFVSGRFKDDVERESLVDFVRTKEVFQNAMENEISSAQRILFTLRGFLYSIERLNRDKFYTFTTNLAQDHSNPSLYSIAYLQNVSDDNLVSYEKEVGKVEQGFAVFPNKEGGDHFIVRYESPQKGTMPVIGFDASTDVVVNEALVRARDTGRPAISAERVSTADPKYRVFLVALPLYRKEAATESLEQRRETLTGFVVALYVKDLFFGDILARLRLTGLDIEVFDGEITSRDKLLFDSDVSSFEATRPDPGTLAEYESYGILGRVWTIFYSFHPSRVLTEGQYLLPYIVLYAGISFGLLFFLIILLLSSSRSRAKTIALEMMSELRNFKLAVDNSSSHIIITDPDAKILYANAAAERTTGYAIEEIIGQNPRLWGGQMGREFYQKMWQTIKTERKPFRAEVRNKRKSGEIYTVLMTISPIIDERRELIGFVGLEDDITERKRAEDAIAEGKAKSDAILASIGDGVVVIDTEEKVILANQAAEKLLGWKAEEMLGKNYKNIWYVKDGLGNVVASGRPIERSLSENEAISTSEYFYTRKDGSDFPVQITISPINLNGRLMEVVDVFRDISQEKAVDRAKTEFVSLASHQLRTPLSAVNWYAEMLLSGDLGAVDPSQKKYLEEIYQSNKRMVELVNALLNVSRIDLGTFAIEPEQVSVIDLAKSVVTELRPQITFKKLIFTEDYDPSLPMMQADPKLVRIIIQNLVTNAVKYTPAGGKVDLAVKLMKKGEGVGGRALPLDSVLIGVSDTGYGIPEVAKEKIFTKLFRADNVKEKETEGTGLGLYIVKAIADASGGQAWFESTVDAGSKFYVALPLPGMAKREGAKQLSYDVFSRINIP